MICLHQRPYCSEHISILTFTFIQWNLELSDHFSHLQQVWSLKIDDTNTAEPQIFIFQSFSNQKDKTLVVRGTFLRPVTSDSETVPAVKVFSNRMKFTQGTRKFISTTNRTIRLNIWAASCRLQFSFPQVSTTSAVRIQVNGRIMYVCRVKIVVLSHWRI